jgi:hypothetical protein
MIRRRRLALLAALALLVALAGTALATRSPVADPGSTQHADEGEIPDEAALQRIVDRLGANDVETTPEELGALAAEHGVGGAVRILAWTNDGTITIQDVEGRRAEGRGWGEIAKELGVEPGIGAVMGNGGGHGRDHAPGQQKDRGADD